MRPARSNLTMFRPPLSQLTSCWCSKFRYDMSCSKIPRRHGDLELWRLTRSGKLFPTTRWSGFIRAALHGHQTKTPGGFGDFSWQVKFRAFSDPKARRLLWWVVFWAVRPHGTQPNGLGHSVLSPTFAVAKASGPWDVQTTIGANLPASGHESPGSHPLSSIPALNTGSRE